MCAPVADVGDDGRRGGEQREVEPVDGRAVHEEVEGRVEVRAGVRADRQRVDVRRLASCKTRVERRGVAGVSRPGGDFAWREGVREVDDFGVDIDIGFYSSWHCRDW